MRPRSFLAAALLALLPLASAPAAPKPAAPGVDPREAQVQEHVLENGLKVVLWPTEATPLVSVWTWYRVGSRHERPGASGLSHLLEHMTFKGTEGIPTEEMTRTVDRRGGRWNGYTWLDQTAYFETATRDALPDLLRLEAERMSKATLSEADFEAERKVVMAELAGSENNPQEVLHREVVAAAIKAHPYHWPTLGWSTDLATITRDELVAHYRSWYHPGNATLVVVGDFDPVVALARVKEAFGGIEPRAAAPEKKAVEPPQHGERRVLLSRPGSARHLQVSWRAPAFSDPDFAAYLVADAVLAGAKGTNLWSMADSMATRTSRLHAAVVATGLATHASSSLAPTADPFLVSLRLTVADGADAAKVESAAILAAEGLADAVTPKEIERAKAQLSARLVFESASVTDLGHQLGFFETAARGGAGWRAFFRLPSAVKAVTLADVKRVAAKYWTADNRTVGWYQPVSSSGGAAPAHHGAGDAARKKGGAARVPAPSRFLAHGGWLGASAAAPAAKPAPVGPAVKRSVLRGGLVVLAVRNPLAPEVVVRVDTQAGSGWEAADKAGLAALAAHLVPSGGGTRGEAAVADVFDSAGATIDVEVDEERAVLTARMLADDAAALLPVLRDLVVTPTFPPAAFEREKTAAIADARERGEDTRAVAEATLRAALYDAADARGRHPRGTATALALITRADVAEFHRRTWRPDGTVIVISGDLDPAAATKLVKKAFGTWKASGAKPAPPAPRAPAAAEPGWVGRIRLASKTQTDVVLGWDGLARSHPDWLALRAANTALGEIGLGGRIGRALREEKALAYYAWSSLDGGASPGPVLVRTGVDPAKAEEAIATVRAVLAKAITDGVTETELADAKALLTGELHHRFETNASTADFLADLEHWKLGVDFPKKHAAAVDALTLDEVNRAAKTWIRADGIAVTAGP